MKRTFLVLTLIAITAATQAQPTVHNMSGIKVDFSSLTRIIEKELALDTSKIEIYVCVSNFNKGINYQTDAAVNTISQRAFVINIRYDLFKKEQIQMFIHEMVHVSQVENKRLLIRPSFVWFEGSVLRSDTKYEERPYELEAMQRTEEILIKFRKELKCL